MLKNTEPILNEDLTQKNAEEQENFAEKFSEDCSQLKDCLLSLWKSGFTTYACCAGHNEEVPFENGSRLAGNPYVMFEVSSLKEDELNFLLKNILNLKHLTSNAVEVAIQIDNIAYFGKERHSLSVYFVNKDVNLFKEVEKFVLQLKKKDFTAPESVLTSEDRTFIEFSKRLNNLNMDDYLKNETDPANKNEMISLHYGKKINQTTLNAVKTYWISAKINDVFEDFFVAKGFVTKIKDKYVTYKNNEIIEITKEEALTMPNLKNLIKNELRGELNQEQFNSVLTNMEYVIKDNNEVVTS